jgi:hypothetical protein
MAECEHVRGAEYPILPIISDSIVYKVPEEEAKKFSNRNLTDPAVIALLRERFSL